MDVTLYAIAGSPLPEPLDGELEQLRAGRVVAILAAAAEPAAGGEEDALRHAEVVERLAAATDALLPSRYGVRFPSRAALSAAVQEHDHELAAGLRRVAGCVELAVLGLTPPPPVEAGRRPEGTGRAYLEGRRTAVAAAEAVRERVHRPLSAIARAACFETGRTFRGSYLVRRADAARFAQAVEALAAEEPALALVCVGPWAPYSFAGEVS